MNKEKTSPKVLKDLRNDLDRRAFLKKYAKSLKGPAKIAIFVFSILKDQNQSISSDEIKNRWNNVTSILGKYNPAYLVRAREYGFLKEDETKKRHYKLTNNWFGRLTRKYHFSPK